MSNLSAENIAAEALQLHSDMVYKLALSQMKNKADAEDIFREVFCGW